jgi:tryptophanyl-tRNA synthetase
MKKRIFSGIQPSGNLHLGNYLGAIKNWVALQDEYESIFCVVDMHAITVPQDPEKLRKKTIEVAKIYLASGIDPKKSSIFIQSHVNEHAELMWVLNTITKNGDLTKMTQFKDKTGLDLGEFEEELNFLEGSFNRLDPVYDKKEYDIDEMETALAGGWRKVSQEMIKDIRDRFRESVILPFNTVGVGLFDYPVLMAADIILYGTEIVPVGEDQKQHVELARDLAKRFNHKFGDTFIVPKAHVKEEGMRIMGLDDPKKKMSKSAASEYNYIALTDDIEKAKKKIMKAVTDSGTEIVYGDEKPAIKNLINIYTLLSDKTKEEIVAMYEGKGYGDFKKDLAEVVAIFLTQFQEKYNAISDDDVLQILHEGAERVRPIAKIKMDEVKKRVGFVL